MDWFSLFKLLHVICAVIWVGGGFTLLVAAEIMRRKRGSRGMMAVVDAVALLGPPLFVPVSALTIVFGVFTAWFGVGFAELWVLLGTLCFLATFLDGLLMIKPRAEKMSAVIAAEGPDSPRLLPAADTLLKIARFDYVMLALVIVDMVVKPSPGNVWLLAAMGVVLVVGAFLALGSALRAQPVTA